MSHSTSWNPESYAGNARFVADLGEPLLRLLDPKPGELILDLDSPRVLSPIFERRRQFRQRRLKTVLHC